MTDYTLIKTAAEHAIKARGTLLSDAAQSNYDGLVTPEAVFELACAHEQAASDLKFTQQALDDTSTTLDQLKAENEALRKKITTVHFVCDRIPDQDGCRFIELENPQGESLGSEAGEWEVREGGLAQLVVGLVDDGVRKDAERYRFLREDEGGEDDLHVQFYESGPTVGGSQLDELIDAAMNKEAGE